MNSTDSHRAVFRPERFHLLVVVLMAMLIAIPVSHAPLKLAWAWLLPIGYLVWVLRVRTVVDDSGVQVQRLFSGSKSVAWENVDGVGFKGAGAFLRHSGGERTSLPAVTFNDLPKLAEASQGRIPDALTAGREAADNMVTIERQDGSRILVTPEEYAAMQENKD